ncbi:MAG: cyanoexosortase A system-associated protein [Microcystaceae cyanobacterium]
MTVSPPPLSPTSSLDTSLTTWATPWRRWLLLGLLGGTVLTGITVLFWPPQSRPQAIAFPDTIPLDGWQPVKNPPPLSPPREKNADELFHFINGHAYQYQRGDQTLRIEMRYFAPVTADVHSLLTYYWQPNPPDLEIQQKEGIGYFALLTDPKQTYLSTCLTPRGGTTVNREQFTQLRYRQDLTPLRVAMWAIGQGSLLDSRCLWITLSVPNSSSSPNASPAATLTTVFPQWLDQWRSRFEKHPL